MRSNIQAIVMLSLVSVFGVVKIDELHSRILPPQMISPFMNNLTVSELPTGNWVIPPEEFQGNGSAIIHFIDYKEAPKFCGHPYAGGCQPTDRRGRPNIIVPNPCEYTEQSYAAVLCHELAHVNGWAHGDQGELPTYTCRTKSGEVECERD
jgi:hypothetical protein